MRTGCALDEAVDDVVHRHVGQVGVLLADAAVRRHVVLEILVHQFMEAQIPQLLAGHRCNEVGVVLLVPPVSACGGDVGIERRLTHDHHACYAAGIRVLENVVTNCCDALRQGECVPPSLELCSHSYLRKRNKQGVR